MVVILLCLAAPGAANPQAGPAEISADLGPCSALVTVTDADLKPVYGAKITARVQYGFMSLKKLDLEAFTGTDGKVKITGLPETLKKPMVIHVSKDEKADQVEFSPSATGAKGEAAGGAEKAGNRCHAAYEVQLK
jgi:hypothetical protein